MKNIINSKINNKEIKNLKIKFSAIKKNISITPHIALNDDKKRLNSQIQGIISESKDVLRANAIHFIKSDNIPLEIVNHEMTIKKRLEYVSSNRAINKEKLWKNVAINSIKPINRLAESYEKATEYLIKEQGAAFVSSLVCSAILDGGITVGLIVSSGAIFNGINGLTKGVAETSISTFNGIENLKKQIKQPKNIKDAQNTIKNIENQNDFYDPQEKKFSEAVGILVKNTNAQIYPFIQKIQKNDKIAENLSHNNPDALGTGKICNKLKKYTYMALQYDNFKHIARISKPLESLEKSSVIVRKDNGFYVNMMK